MHFDVNIKYESFAECGLLELTELIKSGLKAFRVYLFESFNDEDVRLL